MKMKSFFEQICLFLIFTLAISYTTIAEAKAKLKYRNEHEVEGVVLLDSFTFPHIVPHVSMAVGVLIVNKREIGNYGTDSIRADFFDFARTVIFEGDNSDQIFFAQVIVNGAQNLRLVERMGVPSDFVHPVFAIFKPGQKTPVFYPAKSPYEPNSLTAFVAKYASIFINIPGLVKSFSEEAKKFLQLSQSDRTANIAALETRIDALDENEKDNGRYYLKVMKNIVEKGDSYVTSEQARLDGIMKSEKVSDTKKADVQKRLNVIAEFNASDAKNEL